MNKKFLVLLVVPMIIGIFFIISSENQIENFDEKKIIQNQNIETKNNFEEVQPSDIESIIEEKYDNIKSSDDNWKPSEREWQSSGPFKIDRKQYILGEKIFLIAENIDFEENGQIVFLRTLNSTHYSVWKTFPFDGMQKTAFSIYFEPRIQGEIGICSKQDLIGDWKVFFKGVDYDTISFRIIDKILPGDEAKFNKIEC